MKKIMHVLAGVFTVSWIITIILYQRSKKEVILTLAITFGTCAYHFVMRLLVGYLINYIYHNRMDYKRKWFQPKPWEKRVYKVMKVKAWKDKMPTYDVDTFSMKIHSIEEVVQGMCQSEVVHEMIAVFSFVPIIFSVWFESFWIFLITSILAAGFDMIFVIIQRYNRPRLWKILNKSKM